MLDSKSRFYGFESHIAYCDMFQDLKTPQVMKAEFLGILTGMLKENKAFEKDTETDQEEEEEEKEI